MAVLDYNKLAAAQPSLDLDATRYMGSLAFQKIMSNIEVPRDPDAGQNPHYLRQSFNRTDTNDMAIAKLAYIAARAPIVLMTDLDGTGARFTEHVEDSHLVPGYLDALIRIHSTHALSNDPQDRNYVYAVTGRSEEDAMRLLSVGGRLPIPLIHSHGAGLINPNGTRDNIMLTEKEDEFLRRAHGYAETRKDDPDLQVQIKPNGIDIKDFSGRKIQDIRADIKQLMKHVPTWLDCPTFAIHNEGPAETSIRYEVADKARSIEHYIISKADPKTDILYIFAGDSFGRGGTDLAAASLIQSLGGVVIRVQNDRPGCTPNPDVLQPNITLPNPEALATLMISIADTKEALARNRNPQAVSEPTAPRA
jgi:hypothetical protein